MAEWVSATVRSVADLLKPNRRFRTPAYQRPYAWTIEQIDQLLSDLRAHPTGAAAAGQADAPYILGQMIFVNRPPAHDYQIVDGQQRLMALTMLLAILRDLDPEASALAASHLLARPLFGAEVEPLIRPRDRDARFFYDNIQRAGASRQLSEDITPETEAQARILACALWLRRELCETPKRELPWLAELILRGCLVVEITAASEELAHTVFQTVNDRGAPLGVNDVLKSDVIGALPVLEQIDAAARWEDLEADLGDDDFSLLFSHLRTLHRPRKAERAVLVELREILRPETHPETFLRRELLPRGRALLALKSAALNLSAHQERANRLVRGLNRLPQSDWRTLAMGFFADRRPRGDEALIFLTALDRLAFAMALAGANENTRIARYRKPIDALRAGAALSEICEILELTAHERQTARDVLEGQFYAKERVRLPVLLRIDEQLAETGAYYELGDVSVEHILPQNPPPGSPWRELFPDAKKRRRLTDRIGNLTLLSRRTNSDAANLPFERKKMEYFTVGGTTPFALTTRLVTEPEWTPEALERRQKLMVDTACRMWRL